MTFSKSFSLIAFFLILISCKTEIKKNPFKSTIGSSIKYAKGFDIAIFDNYTKLIIKSPYPNSNQAIEYVLTNNKTVIEQLSKKDKIIQIPIKSSVVTSTTHLPMLELLNVESTLVGFPNTQYISSIKIRNLVKNGAVKEIGNDASLNTEILIDLNPDAVIAFAMNSGNKGLKLIEKAGIPVIYNGDWLEETPLGRAEWIKFFGILYNKSEKADSIFNKIETDYLLAKKIASSAKEKPTVLSGVMFKDVWNLPAGESFVSQLLTDANTDYLWSNTKGKGSLQLNFENVLDKGQNASIWIAPGHYETKGQLLNASNHYNKFSAFKNDKVYTFANSKGKTGGVIYYELAPTRPDLVLKDIIKIAHPELLPNYEMTFFDKLE